MSRWTLVVVYSALLGQFYHVVTYAVIFTLEECSHSSQSFPCGPLQSFSLTTSVHGNCQSASEAGDWCAPPGISHGLIQNVFLFFLI